MQATCQTRGAIEKDKEKKKKKRRNKIGGKTQKAPVELIVETSTSIQRLGAHGHIFR
jgi:hypothetical protein